MAPRRTSYYRVYVGVITLLAFHVQKGHGIRCYSCSSKNHEACLKLDTSEYQPVHCDTNMLLKMKDNAKDISKDYEKIFDVDTAHLGDVDLVCLKVVVRDGNKDVVLRGCQLGLHSHLDICKKIEEQNSGMIQKVHCSKCNKDECNSSIRSFHIDVALTIICCLASFVGLLLRPGSLA